jgi:hypothetical protein
MSIVSTIYPDPRRSLARESARCRRSPLPRRSLPVDVVDDRCDPSVLLLTRLEPRRRAPAKADSRLSGFGLLPVRKPNMCLGAKKGFWIESRMAPPMRLCHTDEPTLSSMPCVHHFEVAPVHGRSRRLLELSSESLELCGSLWRGNRPTRRSRVVSALQITYPRAREGPRAAATRLCPSFMLCWSGFCKIPKMLRTRLLPLQALEGLQKDVKDRCDWCRLPQSEKASA